MLVATNCVNSTSLFVLELIIKLPGTCCFFYLKDFMTADWAALPDALIRKVSTRIINEVNGINRVVLDVR